ARLSAWRTPRTLRRWAVMITSALIGSFSHIALDQFTHGYGWVVQNVDWLQYDAFSFTAGNNDHVVSNYDLLQVGLSVVGAIVTILCIRYIGQRRLVRAWYPDVQPLGHTPVSRALLIGSTAAATLGGMAFAVATVDIGPVHDLVIRVADLAFIGLVIGSALARPRMVSRSARGSGRRAVTVA